jgi:hypothetical protein
MSGAARATRAPLSEKAPQGAFFVTLQGFFFHRWRRIVGCGY